MRLDKFLCECGRGSRKEIKKAVKAGIVRVNGEAVKKSDLQVDEESDRVEYNGVPVVYRRYVYFMLNKPAGYVSATEDKRYPAVTELVPEEYAHYEVYPVGRLDIDTEGLLVLTNDGQYAHEMTSPAKNIYKTYFARLDRPAEAADIEAFAAGMEFSDFTAKPAVLELTENPTEVYISIREGKFHQVKRMCAKVGKEVLYLKRIRIGDMCLDPALEPGEIKDITEEIGGWRKQ